MFKSRRIARVAGMVALALGTLPMFSLPASALAAAPTDYPSLKRLFESAWSRQPEARSLGAWNDAAQARLDMARNWTADAPVLEASAKSGRPDALEQQAGVALPLWLPGERAQSAALAEAAQRAVASRARGAQLRGSGEVRAMYWAWLRARIDRGSAAVRLVSARQLAADVARRVAAGDLARADQHQADAAAALAESVVAESSAILAGAHQQLAA